MASERSVAGVLLGQQKSWRDPARYSRPMPPRWGNSRWLFRKRCGSWACLWERSRQPSVQPRHLDLQLRLTAMRMMVEYLHDHAGPIKNMHAGCALEVTCLAWRYFMIDNHE